jgi:hypothetical protein
MSKIGFVIPPASFEIVRDRIAAILQDELFNQFSISYDPEVNATVLIEDIDPIDKSGLPTVNVSFAGGPYDLKNYGATVKGSYQYFIDAYAHSKTTATTTGDYRSAIRLHRLLAILRYVLENPIYKTLGYMPGFIQRVYVSSIDVKNQPGSNDALNSMMGRLTFNVDATESIQLITPELIQGYETTGLIGNSGKGYFMDSENY